MPRIEMIVRVDDDSFEARVVLPITADKKQITATAATWIAALKSAIDTCVVPLAQKEQR